MSNAYSDQQTTSKPTQATTTGGEGATGSSAGEGSPVNAGSMQFAASGNAKIDTSPLVVNAAINAVTASVNEALKAVGDVSKSTVDALKTLVENQGTSTDAALGNSNATLQQVLASESALAAQVQSQGATENQKTLLYIVGAIVVAILGTVFFVFRKS